MKLPKLVFSLWFIVYCLVFLFFPPTSNLQPPTIHAVDEDPITIDLGKQPEQLEWVYDKDVDLAGRTAVRSKELLNWVIANYQWSSIGGDNQVNPFDTIWISVRNIVFGVLGLFILAAAFLLIITQGKSITVRKFIPRFVLVVVLVFLSFAIVQFLFQIGDIVQDFFLQVDKNGQREFINDGDLLSIGFDYDKFEGVRVADPKYNEAAFISTLLVKLTAITYYAVFIILIIRKVILWFFLVVSPIFPLLLLFKPLRNSAKIWVGEFFRWLLYAPLFAVLLAGLVSLWRLWDRNVPLNLQNLPCQTPVDPNSGNNLFPTATNILLGGPCQQVGFFNNLNTPDSFIQYVIALLMLWMVIIVPFILLRIFLDYFHNMGRQNNLAKYIANASSPFIGRYRSPSPSPVGPVGPPPTTPGTPPPSLSTGLAKSLPTFEHSQIAEKMQQSASANQAASRTIDQLAARNIEASRNISQGLESSQPAFSEAASRIEAQAASNIAASQSESAGNQAMQSIEQQASNVAQMALGANQSNIVELARGIQTVAATNLQSQITSGQNINTQAFKNIASQAHTMSQVAQSSGMPALSQAASRIEQSALSHIDVMEQMSQQVNQEILNLTSLSIPTITEIAKYETTLLGGESMAKTEVQKVTEVLSRISGASPITTPAEQQHFTQIKNKLMQESAKGNAVAKSILAASKGKDAQLPESNDVQPVNLESYEEVKKTWTENYKKLDPPVGPDGKPQTRKDWVMEDVKKIPEAIELLLSGDPAKQEQGKQIVSKILPFLLLGGFSKQEIIAYLKAKLEAAKQVLAEVSADEKDNENKIELETHKKAANDKTMQAEIEEPKEDSPADSHQPSDVEPPKLENEDKN